MTLALAIALVLSLAATAGLVAYLYTHRSASSGIRRHLRVAVIVHTTESRSIKGVLVGEYRDAIALAHAEYLQGEDGTSLAGEILVPRTKVAFIQIVPVPAEVSAA